MPEGGIELDPNSLVFVTFPASWKNTAPHPVAGWVGVHLEVVLWPGHKHVLFPARVSIAISKFKESASTLQTATKIGHELW